MFLIGAIWNWVIAIPFLLNSFLNPSALLDNIKTLPPSLIFIHMVIILVIIFGIGFFIVSRDITKNHGIVQMSVIEKFSFFIVFLNYFLIGDIYLPLLLIVIVDLVFGILYLEFLISYKKIS